MQFPLPYNDLNQDTVDGYNGRSMLKEHKRARIKRVARRNKVSRWNRSRLDSHLREDNICSARIRFKGLSSEELTYINDRSRSNKIIVFQTDLLSSRKVQF